MSNIYERAQRAIPGVRELDEAIVRAEKLRASASQYRAQVEPDVSEELLTGDVDPDDLLRRISECVAAKSNADAIAIRASNAVRLFQNRQANLVKDGADDALALIRDEVSRIHDRANELFQVLANVYTPADAIQRGCVDEWQEVNHLVTDLHAARSAQAKLHVGSGSAVLMENYGWVRGLDLILRVNEQVNQKPSGALVSYPFPNVKGRPQFNLDYLRWFVTRPFDQEFGAWVPTRREMDDEQEKQAKRTRARQMLFSQEFRDEQLESVACGYWKSIHKPIGDPERIFVVNDETVSRVLNGVNN